MTLDEINNLYNGDAIPSVELLIEAYVSEKIAANGETVTTYIANMEGERIPLKMHFIVGVSLFVGHRYLMQSIPASQGFEGISFQKFKDYKAIKCTPAANWQTIKPKTHIMPEPETTTPQHIPAPVNMDTLQNYILKMYFETRMKALTKEISDQHAHEIAVQAAIAVPNHWFGAKDLPL